MLVALVCGVQGRDSPVGAAISANFYFIEDFGVSLTASETDRPALFIADRFVVSFVVFVFVFLILFVFVFFVLVFILFAIEPLHEPVDQSERENGTGG